MANYRDIGISDAPFKAGVDLTGKQYYFVGPGSIAGEVIVSVGPSGNPWPIGIVQNAPSSGQEAQVRVLGFSKLVCEANACALAWGRWVVCASDGQGEPTATEAIAISATSAVMARYMDSGTLSSGCQISQVYIAPFPSLNSCGIFTAS